MDGRAWVGERRREGRGARWDCMWETRKNKKMNNQNQKKKKNIFLSKHIDIEMTPRSPPAFFSLFLRHSKCSVVLLPIFSRPTI